VILADYWGRRRWLLRLRLWIRRFRGRQQGVLGRSSERLFGDQAFKYSTGLMRRNPFAGRLG
jgi:hypothetical protein